MEIGNTFDCVNEKVGSSLITVRLCVSLGALITLRWISMAIDHSSNQMIM
jgi:hypothetical protein